jgi:4-amino-4-deoxy-L-arabinose transferase-like glycosyltransferase
MRTHWLLRFAALAATLATLALVLADLADAGLRRWWEGHALTTDTVAGLLVLLITVLVADQVVSRRQVKDRSQAVAAQAAIVAAQAVRTAKAVAAALDGSGDRAAASDEVRTYMMMLLVAAPVLIDARDSRHFLEEAQNLVGEMVRALTALAGDPDAGPGARAWITEAAGRLKTAAIPLLQSLTPEQRSAVTGDEAV